MTKGKLVSLSDIFDDGNVSMITEEDIATSLSGICRYNGYAGTYYSVAEHSLLLASWVLRSSLSNKKQLAYNALMHDASESILGDIIGPIKVQLKDFNRLESRLTSLLQNKFLYHVDPLTDHLDKRIWVDEKRRFFPLGEPWPWIDPSWKPLGVNFLSLCPSEAKYLWLDYYHYTKPSLIK